MSDKTSASSVTQIQYRTHTNGELKATHVGESVRLSGWVHSRRDHGGLIFIDLRDRWGITQLTFDPSSGADIFSQAEKLRSEFVVTIEGKVAARPAEMVNTKLPTGEVEVQVVALTIQNEAKTPPFEIASEEEVNEELRLSYRYLDLRRTRMQRNVQLRHELIRTIREYYHRNGFL